MNLACDTCGSDNMNSAFAKNEGDCCRQFGCFGTMKKKHMKLNKNMLTIGLGLTLLTLGLLALACYGQECPVPPGYQVQPCPPTPDGFCPFLEKFATPGLVQEPSLWYQDHGIQIQWQAVSGRYYEVQFTRDLTSPVWIVAWNGIIPVGFPTTVTSEQTVYGCDQSRFYRVMTTVH